jgi:hypothetical protein
VTGWGGGTTGKQSPSGYHEANFDLKTNIKIFPKTSLTLALQSVNQYDVPVYIKENAERAFAPHSGRGYTRLERFNIYSSYTFRFITASVTFRNLLKEDYRLHGSGMNGTGRSVFLGLLFRF